MFRADIGIVGGGLGGSIAAAMLGRAGISVVLIDTHHPYPEDSRCEKIEEKHFKLLRQTGLSALVVRWNRSVLFLETILGWISPQR
jgi:2-polyprenyl-6-methoxyphenol hydroxylase-like FAD-dependent oxidoreductase